MEVIRLTKMAYSNIYYEKIYQDTHSLGNRKIFDQIAKTTVTVEHLKWSFESFEQNSGEINFTYINYRKDSE